MTLNLYPGTIILFMNTGRSNKVTFTREVIAAITETAFQKCGKIAYTDRAILWFNAPRPFSLGWRLLIRDYDY